jgi:hypothetical protein
MSTVILTMSCPNEDCGAEIEVKAEVEPGERGYGSDADGNRGIDLEAYVHVPDAPGSCPACNRLFTPDERAELAHELECAAQDYDFNEGPEAYDD